MGTTGYTATFHAYQGNIFVGDFPHAFVTISAPGQQTATVGYYPVTTRALAPGIVKNDALSGPITSGAPTPHEATYSKTFDIRAMLKKPSTNRWLTR